MDLNKEIKLSDLFRRGKGSSDDGAAPKPKPEKEPKERKSFSFSRSRGEKAPKAPKEPKAGKGTSPVEPRSAAAAPAVPLMRAFDLMPKEGEREKSSSLASPQLLKVGIALVAVLLLAGFAGAYMMFGAKVGEKQSQADDLRAQLAELTAQASPDQSSTPASLTAAAQARTAALSDALSSRVAWDRILREFSLVLPEGVWLTSLSSTTPTAAAGAAPAGDATFVITGSAEDQAHVALLLSRLEVVPEFASVQLQSSARGGNTEEGGLPPDNPLEVGFTINVRVAPKGVPAE